MSQLTMNSSNPKTKPAEKDIERNLSLTPPRKKKLFRFLFKQNPPVPESQGVYPEPKLNFFSKYTYTWVGPILKVSISTDRANFTLLFKGDKKLTNFLSLRSDMSELWK